MYLTMQWSASAAQTPTTSFRTVFTDVRHHLMTKPGFIHLTYEATCVGSGGYKHHCKIGNSKLGEPGHTFFSVNHSGTEDNSMTEVITGRIDEVINRGGDKLAPEVIEGALRQMPEIADAAVFAVPNTDQIWAAVVGKQPLKHEAILAFCKTKLAGMAPDRIFELERIPRNDMGKIIREEMREAIMKRLSSSFM